MADVFTTAKRSEVMSRIRSSGNAKTELRLISLFRKNGIVGWRRKQRLCGRPDFVFRKHRIVIFVDGCFWHGCPRCFRRPTSNQAYWDRKIARNRLRDRHVTTALRRSGWTVIRIWEHLLCDGAPSYIRRIKRLLGL